MTPSAPHPKSPPVSFVTVVYAAELGLLCLQARSMARFIPEQDVAEILIVLNDRDPAALARRVSEHLEDWGVHSSKVRLIDPAEIFSRRSRISDIPNALRAKLKQLSRALRGHPETNWARRSGWLIQQAMKLAAARAAKGTHLVYLDAKNQFTGQASSADFFTEAGIARARLGRVQDNYFDWHQSARTYLGHPAVTRDDALPPSITPYCATKDDVLVTLEEIERRSGAIQYFFEPKSPKGTEFTLLASIQMRKGALKDGLIPFTSIFRDATTSDVADMIAQAETGAVRMIGTHSGKLRELTEVQLRPLYRLWHKLGLVSGEDQAMAIAPPKGAA